MTEKQISGKTERKKKRKKHDRNKKRKRGKVPD